MPLMMLTMSNKQQERKTVSVTEAAAMLGLDRTTVTKLLQDGDLKGYKKTLGLTSPWRIYVDSIEEFKRLREN